MNRPIKMFSATLVLGAALGASGAAHAADATFNQCWGQITKQFVALDDGQPGIGEHASSPPGIEPGEGRSGVGNVSKEHAPLSEGGQGEHAVAVGGNIGLTCELAQDVP